MPIMQVYYPEDALDDARKADLAQRLTDTLITMEDRANTPGARMSSSSIRLAATWSTSPSPKAT